MTIEGFESTFRIRLGRHEVWSRLTAGRDLAPGDVLWLAGFDARVRVGGAEPGAHLRGTKDEEPCVGTDIVVTLEDDASGTRVRVVQSGFGDWLEAAGELAATGWRFIVADLQTFLATGAHPGRHLRAWIDLGASVSTSDGAVRVDDVAADGSFGNLGLVCGDLVVSYAGAPVATVDDLVTAGRAAGARRERTDVEWVRDGMMMSAEHGASGRGAS